MSCIVFTKTLKISGFTPLKSGGSFVKVSKRSSVVNPQKIKLSRDCDR